MLKLDLHIHSIYSKDSILEPKEIIEIAKRKGLNGIAITDHDAIKGALEAIKLNKETDNGKDFIIVPGEEIRTDIGDVLVLFIKKEISSRRIEEVYEEAKKQNAMLVLAHPFRGSGEINPDNIKKFIDVIEVFNSRSTRKQNKAAEELAKKLKKPIICGSDAHLSWEIGKSINLFKIRNIKKEILKNKIKNKDNAQFSTSYSPYLTSRILTALSTISRFFNKTPD